MIGLVKRSGPPADLAAGIWRAAHRTERKLAACVRRAYDKAYYRLLFGMGIPFAPELSRKISALENRRGRGDVPIPAAAWELQYRGGEWAFLRALDQATRYSVICGYLQQLAPKGRVLDIGCGEGVLLERLGMDNYSRYVGIDLSGAAVERAAQKHHARSLFVQADAQTYVPDETFDAIVFNEVLYYFDDPPEVLRRYRSRLEPGGVFITSLYVNSERIRAIGRALKKVYRALDEVEISHDGDRWIVTVFCPGHGGEPVRNLAKEAPGCRQDEEEVGARN